MGMNIYSSRSKKSLLLTTRRASALSTNLAEFDLPSACYCHIAEIDDLLRTDLWPETVASPARLPLRSSGPAQLR